MKHFAVDGKGATAIEYGLIVALISIAILGALGTMSSGLDAMYIKIANATVSP